MRIIYYNVYNAKCVQLYTPVATFMYQMCHIPRQDVIESGKEKNFVWGRVHAITLSIIMHFFSGRSRTRLKNASEMWNLDLDLDLTEIWILIASNKM